MARSSDQGVTSFSVNNGRLDRNTAVEQGWDQFIKDFINHDGTAEFVQDGGGGFWIDYNEPTFILGYKVYGDYRAKITQKRAIFVGLGSFQTNGGGSLDWQDASNSGTFASYGSGALGLG